MEDGIATALIGRLERLEREFGELQYVIRDRLVASWIPDVTKQLREARTDIDSLMAGAPHHRPMPQPKQETPNEFPGAKSRGRRIRPHSKFPKTYEEYVQVIKMQEAGVSIKRSAKLLGLPYSSTYAYAHLSEDEAEELRRKSEAAKKHGYTTLTRRRPPAQDDSAVQLWPEQVPDSSYDG
jgi:DNA invertase Pin-like site-specific DNA recombinase